MRRLWLTLAVLVLAWPVLAQSPGFGRAGAKPVDPECAPAYLAMEPDVFQKDSAQFPARFFDKTRGMDKRIWFTFPTPARCRETRAAVQTVLTKLGTTTVILEDCR